MLSVRSLSRVIAARAVVSEVSFDMAPGEVLAILGPSGSGKTSLLRMIAGFDAPTGGSVRLHGREVSTAGKVRVAPEHREVALAFQDATLFSHLDAVGNAAFAIRAVDKATRQARAREVLRDMGLTAMDGRDVATLSGGEAQRVSLARALAADARLLLLDEPFGNVDRLTRTDLLARLKARLATGLGAIIITHDPADAVELGARVLLMRDGAVTADGSHEAIATGQMGEWERSFLLAGNN
ncbi:ATP-binding cassette domain-containing protein [Accumulibacter sp.]|uniref:ATP-binding cassette domain-containing protein n=1 Tax=Accumulibacter sp. TaxID=2053492 RepID=UPI001A4F8565|nr:ATP-binding cassette domain-containing protein [Accumulibacter sp.]MBL8373715.1 ATP-binding cassette domain-containing protein [Accumulibacter sp.]